MAAKLGVGRLTKSFAVNAPISEVKAILGPPFDCQWHGCGLGTVYTWFLPDGSEVGVHCWDYTEVETVESIYVKRPGEQGQRPHALTVCPQEQLEHAQPWAVAIGLPAMLRSR